MSITGPPESRHARKQASTVSGAIAPGMAQSRASAAPSSALSLHGQPQRPGTASVDLHGLGQAGVHLLKLTVERFAAPCGDVATTTLKCAFFQVVWEVSLSGRLRCAERGEALLHSLESRPGRLSAADAPHCGLLFLGSPVDDCGGALGRPAGLAHLALLAAALVRAHLNICLSGKRARQGVLLRHSRWTRA